MSGSGFAQRPDGNCAMGVPSLSGTARGSPYNLVHEAESLISTVEKINGSIVTQRRDDALPSFFFALFRAITPPPVATTCVRLHLVDRNREL